jgi:hypothetical protein
VDRIGELSAQSARYWPRFVGQRNTGGASKKEIVIPDVTTAELAT